MSKCQCPSKKTVKGTSCASIARILGHNVKAIKQYLKNMSSQNHWSDKCKMQVMTTRDNRKVKYQVIQCPGSISKKIFQDVGLGNGKIKTTQNCILVSTATVKFPLK